MITLKRLLALSGLYAVASVSALESHYTTTNSYRSPGRRHGSGRNGYQHSYSNRSNRPYFPYGTQYSSAYSNSGGQAEKNKASITYLVLKNYKLEKKIKAL